MTELKPCPFCGGEARLHSSFEWSHVSCEKCFASTSIRISEEQAIEAWNNRPNPWRTGAPARSGEYLVCIRYDFGKEGFTTANYIEPFSPHNGWYNIKPPSVEDGHEWCKKNGIEVIAWQEFEPYKEQ